jgi:hypothetical protein
LKPTAREHLARIRRLSEIVVLYGHVVSRLEEPRPGYIVQEDESQVVAKPTDSSVFCRRVCIRARTVTSPSQ